MNKKERAYYILEKMEELFPEAQSELENWETPFQFLIAIILSAQTTDLQVNKVTKNLFEQYPTPEELQKAEKQNVEKIIGSINYYRTKTKNIIGASSVIAANFNGSVPDKVSDLMTLPGVGRKTANVYLNGLYQANQGVGVDTHVMRVSKRLGLTKNKTPEKIADDLERIYNQDDWYKVTNLFVLYGRYVCKARVKPEESKCVFKDFCSHCGSIS